MKHLNDTNGASKITLEYAKKALELDTKVIGAEFGIAYGGGVESIGKLWGQRGTIYGFDTFEGHPEEIAEICEYSKSQGGKNSFAARCMDMWYESEEYGTKAIKKNYIQKQLDKQGLTNVKLVKGIVSTKTILPFEKLHYCFIDLDFPLSQWETYNLVKDKIVPGGYLLMHDMIPQGHIHGNYEYYQQILGEALFTSVLEDAPSYTVVMQKKWDI